MDTETLINDIKLHVNHLAHYASHKTGDVIMNVLLFMQNTPGATVEQAVSHLTYEVDMALEEVDWQMNLANSSMDDELPF